jgi:hypothetical protein
MIIQSEVDSGISYYAYASNRISRYIQKGLQVPSTSLIIYTIAYLGRTYIILFYDLAVNIDSICKMGIYQIRSILRKYGVDTNVELVHRTKLESPYSPIEITSLLLELGRLIPSRLQRYISIEQGARIYRTKDIGLDEIIKVCNDYEEVSSRYSTAEQIYNECIYPNPMYRMYMEYKKIRNRSNRFVISRIRSSSYTQDDKDEYETS